MTTNNEAFDINQPFVTQEQKFKYWEESKAEIKKLQASNNTLREALTAIRVWCEQPDTDLEDSIGKLACEALSATPAESLQAFENEVSQCKIDAERYQFVRKLTPREFAEIYDINIKTGVHFDHLISQALKEVK